MEREKDKDFEMMKKTKESEIKPYFKNSFIHYIWESLIKHKKESLKKRTKKIRRTEKKGKMQGLFV